MVRFSRQEQLFHHKFTLELIRALPGTSDYVVTGLKDTPITTSGLLDERGQPKPFALADYRAFNSGTVLLFDWHRRRVWLAGGNRPANPDPFNHFGGQTLYPTLAVSHFGIPLGDVELHWQVNDRHSVYRAGTIRYPQITGGQVESLGMLEIPAPSVEEIPCLLKLRAWLMVAGKTIAHNHWHLWLYPQLDWSDIGKWSLYDPGENLIGLSARNEVFVPLSRGQLPSHPRLLTTHWEAWMRDFIRQGGRVLLILTDGAPLAQIRVPFWREATHLIQPDALGRGLILPTMPMKGCMVSARIVPCWARNRGKRSTPKRCGDQSGGESIRARAGSATIWRRYGWAKGGCWSPPCTSQVSSVIPHSASRITQQGNIGFGECAAICGTPNPASTRLGIKGGTNANAIFTLLSRELDLWQTAARL
jgi:hypothetical protein